MLKTVPLLDVKELPDKIFFGCTLNANLPRPGTLHKSYEERYINQDDSGNLSSIISRNIIQCGSKLVNTFHGS